MGSLTCIKKECTLVTLAYVLDMSRVNRQAICEMNAWDINASIFKP